MLTNRHIMESVFKNPTDVRELITKGMRGKLQEGELEQLEVEKIEESMAIPKRDDTREREPFQLRGEGGSGLGPAPQLGVGPGSVASVEAPHGGVEESLPEEEDDEGREEEDMVSQASVSEQVVEMRRELKKTRNYFSEQIQTFNAVITSLGARIAALENRTGTAIPLTFNPSGHGRSGSVTHGTSGSPPRPTSAGRIRGPPQRKRVINKRKVEEFTQRNKTYPSLKVVRVAKLNQLLTSLGLEPNELSVGVSDWTAERLFQLISESIE